MLETIERSGKVKPAGLSGAGEMRKWLVEMTDARREGIERESRRRVSFPRGEEG